MAPKEINLEITRLSLNNAGQILGVYEIFMDNNIHNIPQEKHKDGFVDFLKPPSFFADKDVLCYVAKDSSTGPVVGCIIGLLKDECFSKRIENLIKKRGQDLEVISGACINVMQICIDRKFRRKSVATKLYTEFERLMKKKFKSLVTEVDHRNKASLEFHKKIGFTEIISHHRGTRKFIVFKKNLM